MPSAAAYQQVNTVFFVEYCGIMKDKRDILKRIYVLKFLIKICKKHQVKKVGASYFQNILKTSFVVD